MSGEICRFIVRHQRLRILVRVMSCSADVKRLYLRGNNLGVPRERPFITAFFRPGRSRNDGTVVVGGYSLLAQLTHEFVHAALHHQRVAEVATPSDERLALAVEELVRKSAVALRRLNYGELLI